MSQEFLVEQSERGSIVRFIGRAGNFYDVIAPDGRPMGTTTTLERARAMLNGEWPEDCPAEVVEFEPITLDSNGEGS